jgi:hypothetical protein
MKPFDRQIRYALETVTNRNGGQFRGDIDTLIEALACEMGSPNFDETIAEFKSYIETVDLGYLTANSEVAFFKTTKGEYSFISRKLLAVPHDK